jgi:hypothetical protein
MPFVYGKHAVISSGMIEFPPAVKEGVKAIVDQTVSQHIQNGTATEYIAALYITNLIRSWGWERWVECCDLDTMSDSLIKTIKQVILLHRNIDGASTSEIKLNLAVTDGEQLIAFRCCPRSLEGPPLYYSTPRTQSTGAGDEDRTEHRRYFAVTERREENEAGMWSTVRKNCGVFFLKTDVL